MMASCASCGGALLAQPWLPVRQLSGPLLAGLLLFPTLGLAAAPVNSWAARRAALPGGRGARLAT